MPTMIWVTQHDRKQIEGYDDWAMWRFAQGIREDEPEELHFRDAGPVADFCVTCAGRGRLFVDTFEGFVPSDYCPTCQGTGKA